MSAPPPSDDANPAFTPPPAPQDGASLDDVPNADAGSLPPPTSAPLPPLPPFAEGASPAPTGAAPPYASTEYVPPPPVAYPASAWSPGGGASRPTRAPTLGRIGFWLLVAALATTVARIVGLAFQAMRSIAGPGLPGNPVISDMTMPQFQVLLTIAATVLGIISLSRRERPIWWGILATAAIPISLGLGAVLFGVAWAVAGM